MALRVPGQFIFLHVPKCGGKWCKAVLIRAFPAARLVRESTHGNAWVRAAHADLEDVEHLPEPKLAFVRHPVDWWRSYWRYRMLHKWDPTHEIDSLVQSATFDGFVDRVLERMPGYASRMFARFVGEPGHEIEFIGRQENLAADLRRGLDALGVDASGVNFEAKRTNEGGAETAHVDFTPAQREALTRAEAEGIERFGYDRC